MTDTRSKPTSSEEPLTTSRIASVQPARVVTDGDGVIRSWDANAEALYGWDAHEVVGRSILEVTVPPDSVDRVGQIMQQMLVGVPWEGVFPVRRKDGSTFEAYVRDVPVIWDGVLRGVLGLSMDSQLVTAITASGTVSLDGEIGPIGDNGLLGMTVTTDEGCTTVSLDGELDISTAPPLCKLVDKLVEQGAQRIVFDMSELKFIDSSGMAAFLHAFRRSQEAGGELALRRPSLAARRILQAIGLASIFPIET